MGERYVSTVDSAQLISLVKEDRTLWEKTGKTKSRTMMMDHWKRIAQKMGSDEKEVKKKWTYLRNHFTAELGKNLENSDSPTSDWPYFESLLFLKKTVRPKVFFKKNKDSITAEDPVAIHSFNSNASENSDEWKFEFSDEDQSDEVVAVKKKWTYLKDQFAVELGKNLEGAENPTSDWLHFDSLLFLKKTVKPRTFLKPRRKSNANDGVTNEVWVEASDEDCKSSDSEMDRMVKCKTEAVDALKGIGDFQDIETKGIESDDDSFGNDDSSDRSSPVDQNARGIRICDISGIGGPSSKRQKLDGESVAIKKGESLEEDEHLAFFQSTLSYVRKIPESSMLKFRRRILNLINVFTYQRS